MPNQPCSTTPYGFTWGPVEVVRMAEIQGSVHLSIETPRQSLVLYVTPSGLIKVGAVAKPRKRKNAP